MSATPSADRLIDGPQIHLHVPADLRAALQEVAREQDKPMARVIRAALREFAERNRPEAVTDP